MFNKNINFLDASSVELNVKQKSVKGGVVTFFLQIVRLIIQIGLNVALARILVPEDFGIYAMVATITNFIIMFKDFGLSQATVQAKTLNDRQVNTLFWTNFVVGLVIFIFMVCISPLVAQFYSQPELSDVTKVLGVGIFLTSIAAQHQALLRRQMMFSTLAILEIASLSISVLLAIIMGLLDFGYWALVSMQVSQYLFMLLGVWVFCSWKPFSPFKTVKINDFLRFGGDVMGYGLVNYFARNADNILIGYVEGAKQLGFYSRAYSLLMLPIAQFTTPFSGIAISGLSRISNSRTQFENYYLRIFKIIAYISFPSVIFLALHSKEIVTLVLGPSWLPASELFAILAFACFWQPVCSTFGWIYVSLARTRFMLYWGIISSLVTVVGFLIGILYGAKGVAISYAIINNLLLLPMLWFATHGTPVSMKRVLKQLIHPFMITGCVIFSNLVIFNVFKFESGFFELVANFILSLVTILVVSVINKNIRYDFVYIFRSFLKTTKVE